MTSPLSLRAMTASDVPEVARIETTAFSTPWSEATFRSLLERSGVELWVAEWGGELAAYAILWRVRDEGELANIAVRGDLRGRGIGSRLLSRMLKVAEDSGVRSLYLEVRESNELAREMYARRGFQEIGVRKGYYEGPREDARVLKKSLEGA
ncbi:MAG: ribosomal protein S18-alanine N-acetyltransferase [Gemmatimonadetes bacterium]|nr:ribosomal protein S18-alanine N-acetyltransferase [Gemmatimonadota bacterium]